jgi:hypothetical protein
VTGSRHAYLLLSCMAALSAAGAGCRVSRAPLHPRHEPGQWYEVEQGESLAQIAGRAGVPVEDLLEVNGLRDSREVHAGSLIFVLDGPSGPMASSKDSRVSSASDHAGSDEGQTAEPGAR